MKVTFDAIKRHETIEPKLYEKIIEQIRHLMLNGELKVGQKVPSERELAEMFNVSRVPVREALKILEFVGIIENIPGKGLHFRNISIKQLTAKIDFAVKTGGDNIKYLFETRALLETKAAGLAAERRTEEDIDEMKKLIDSMEIKMLEGKDVSKVAVEFHSAIVRASKNSVMYNINDSIINMLEYSRKLTLRDNTRATESLDFHRKLLDSISNSDVKKSEEIMAAHLKNAESHYTTPLSADFVKK